MSKDFRCVVDVCPTDLCNNATFTERDVEEILAFGITKKDRADVDDLTPKILSIFNFSKEPQSRSSWQFEEDDDDTDSEDEEISIYKKKYSNDLLRINEQKEYLENHTNDYFLPNHFQHFHGQTQTDEKKNPKIITNEFITEEKRHPYNKMETGQHLSNFRELNVKENPNFDEDNLAKADSIQYLKKTIKDNAQNESAINEFVGYKERSNNTRPYRVKTDVPLKDIKDYALKFSQQSDFESIKEHQKHAQDNQTYFVYAKYLKDNITKLPEHIDYLPFSKENRSVIQHLKDHQSYYARNWSNPKIRNDTLNSKGNKTYVFYNKDIDKNISHFTYPQNLKELKSSDADMKDTTTRSFYLDFLRDPQHIPLPDHFVTNKTNVVFTKNQKDSKLDVFSYKDMQNFKENDTQLKDKAINLNKDRLKTSYIYHKRLQTNSKLNLTQNYQPIRDFVPISEDNLDIFSQPLDESTAKYTRKWGQHILIIPPQKEYKTIIYPKATSETIKDNFDTPYYPRNVKDTPKLKQNFEFQTEDHTPYFKVIKNDIFNTDRESFQPKSILEQYRQASIPNNYFRNYLPFLKENVVQKTTTAFPIDALKDSVNVFDDILPKTWLFKNQLQNAPSSSTSTYHTVKVDSKLILGFNEPKPDSKYESKYAEVGKVEISNDTSTPEAILKNIDLIFATHENHSDFGIIWHGYQMENAYAHTNKSSVIVDQSKVIQTDNLRSFDLEKQKIIPNTYEVVEDNQFNFSSSRKWEEPDARSSIKQDNFFNLENNQFSDSPDRSNSDRNGYSFNLVLNVDKPKESNGSVFLKRLKSIAKSVSLSIVTSTTEVKTVYTVKPETLRTFTTSKPLTKFKYVTKIIYFDGALKASSKVGNANPNWNEDGLTSKTTFLDSFQQPEVSKKSIFDYPSSNLNWDRYDTFQNFWDKFKVRLPRNQSSLKSATVSVEKPEHVQKARDLIFAGSSLDERINWEGPRKLPDHFRSKKQSIKAKSLVFPAIFYSSSNRRPSTERIKYLEKFFPTETKTTENMNVGAALNLSASLIMHKKYKKNSSTTKLLPKEKVKGFLKDDSSIFDRVRRNYMSENYLEPDLDGNISEESTISIQNTNEITNTRTLIPIKITTSNFEKSYDDNFWVTLKKNKTNETLHFENKTVQISLKSVGDLRVPDSFVIILMLIVTYI